MHVCFGWFVRSTTQHNVNEIDRENLFTRDASPFAFEMQDMTLQMYLFIFQRYKRMCVSVRANSNSKNVHLCVCMCAFIVNILYYCISTLSNFHSHTRTQSLTHALTNEA